MFRCVLVICAVLAAACGGSQNCKAACDKLNQCNIAASGFQSCSEGCTGQDLTCGQCVNDNSCSAILSGSCGTACPNTTFSSK